MTCIHVPLELEMNPLQMIEDKPKTDPYYTLHVVSEAKEEPSIHLASLLNYSSFKIQCDGFESSHREE